MKKSLIFVTTLLLSAFLLPSRNASARANVSLGEPEKDYFQVTTGIVLEHEFDGSGVWGDKNGIYSTQTSEVDGSLVYTGPNGQFMTIKPDDLYKSNTVTIEFVVELVGVSAFYTCTRESYDNYSYPSILRETGIKDIVYDADGKITSFNRRDGFLAGTDDWSEDVVEITEEGYLHVQYKVVTGSKGIAEIGITAEGIDGNNCTVKMDYFKSSIQSEPAYFTYLWNTSFDDLDTNAAPWDNQPIWANSMEWETEYPLDGTHSIKVNGSAGSGQVQVGGFDTTTPGKQLIKQTGLHYIQMDIDSPDFQWFNIWTLGADYYDIKFDMDAGWSSVGKVQNFKFKDLGHCYRISYYVDYTNVETSHNINVCNGSGSIYFDNLIVAYVDNTPYAKDAEYDLVGTQDVAVSVDLKASDFVALKDGEGNAVDSSSYTLADNTLTLKKELFASLADSYTFKLETSAGVKEFMVSKNDNRKTITGVTATISKVYDGTTTVDMSDVEFELVGLVEGDEVNVSCTLAYSSANVGDAISLVVSNLEFSGADADKYILPEEISLTGSITKKAITVVAEAKEKEAGETDPQLTYTVEGLVEGDTLTGALSREAGEEAGEYDITLGTLSASANYEITFTGAKLTINAKADSGNQGGEAPATPQPEQKGCGGSVIASIFGALALAGSVVVLRKKREE